MKRIFTLSVSFLLTAVLLTSCIRESFPNDNEEYWLSKEMGEVVYSDSYCNYYVVETFYGYTIIRSYGGYKPYEGSIVYGNFSSAGTKDIYNRSYGIIFTGMVTDYWLSYTERVSTAVSFVTSFTGSWSVRRIFPRPRLLLELDQLPPL